RQIGKTYILKEFGKEYYPDFVYCNFEENSELHNLFEINLDVHRIIEELSLYFEKKISEDMLIIFDEIQSCPRALTSLKYFCENLRNYHVVAAGSLLGVKLARASSFPVGKVNFFNMYPMTFLEFLIAMDKKGLSELLQKKNDYTPLSEPFHSELLSLYKKYLFIGGMPEVVFNHIQTRDYQKTRILQLQILKAYEEDFSKHTTKTDAIKISQVWQSVPLQLAREQKKFKYADIKKGGRAKEFEQAIHWLKETGLVHLCFRLKQPGLPIKAYSERSHFKLYALDTGLLGAMLNLSEKTIVEGHKLFNHFHGAFIENFVAQELKAYRDDDLFYWTSESIAEVDFILSCDDHIYPLEVKAGLSNRKKSLFVYDGKYQPQKLITMTQKNYYSDGKFVNIPLYSGHYIL
ncbi:MAG: DUF4143 domain-containing protein, partial [bacterium]